MPSGKLGAVIAAVIGFGYEFVLHFYGWVQDLWGAQLRAAGNLTAWWLLSALTVFVQMMLIIGPTYFLLRNWLRVESKSLLISTSIDLSASVILWFLGAILADPFSRVQLGAVGLGFCSDLLLWLGTIWAVIAFSRLAIVSTQLQKA